MGDRTTALSKSSASVTHFVGSIIFFLHITGAARAFARLPLPDIFHPLRGLKISEARRAEVSLSPAKLHF